MSGRELTLLSFFVAAGLSVVILLAALLAALVISQKRRIALEQEHARRMIAAQEDERSRVARELHDDALQRIALLRHEVDEVARLSPEAGHRLGGVSGELEDLGSVIRTAAHQLHPGVVEKAGLVRALGDLAEEFHRASGLDVRVTLPAVSAAVPPGIGVAVYRIAQEALRNVVRHAGVTQADLQLTVADGTRSLILRVADAGKGFAAGAERPEDGLGLIAMRQRAEALGGRVSVESAPGSGTVVTAVFHPSETR